MPRPVLLICTWLMLLLLSGCVGEQVPAAEPGPAEAPGEPDHFEVDEPDSTYQDNSTVESMDGMTIYRNVRYSNSSARLLLDIYVPQSQDPPPLVVYIHGGSWKIGSKDGCPAVSLIEHGYAVSCINYRLSDEAIFPAQMEDVGEAISWLRSHSSVYGYGADRIGVWGESAGGHLAALIGTSGTGDSRVQAVCDWFGPTDFFAVENESDPGDMYFDYLDSAEDLVGGPLRQNEELVRQANPVTHVTPDDPPFLIMHGKDDTMVPVNQSLALHEALSQAGVDSTLVIVEGAGHGFPMHGETGPSEQYQAVLAFFETRLRD